MGCHLGAFTATFPGLSGAKQEQVGKVYFLTILLGIAQTCMLMFKEI